MLPSKKARPYSNVFVFLRAQRKPEKCTRLKGSGNSQESKFLRVHVLKLLALTHFSVMLRSNTPWKYPKTSNLQMFSGGEGQYWREIG